MLRFKSFFIDRRLDARYRSEYTLSWSIGTPSYSKGEDGIYYSTITPASPARFQEAYHTEDISIFYTNPDGKWTLTAREYYFSFTCFCRD